MQGLVIAATAPTSRSCLFTELLDQIPADGCAGPAEAEPSILPVAHMLHSKELNTGTIVQGQFSLRSYHGLQSRAETFPLLREEILTNVGAFSQTVKQISLND